MNAETIHTPAVTGSVRTLLRMEGLAILATASTAYFLTGSPPWLFALLFFAPDLSFIAYLRDSRWGAVAYNFVHSYVLAALLGGIGWFTDSALVWQLGLILAAHAGFDRMLGYGLKYATAFNHTHLGIIGKKN